jgi:hypothetical protein
LLPGTSSTALMPDELMSMPSRPADERLNNAGSFRPNLPSLLTRKKPLLDKALRHEHEMTAQGQCRVRTL